MGKTSEKKVFVGLPPLGKQPFSTGHAGGYRTKVFVGMSGGVDSSVAAALLKEQGYDVTGVFIKAWYPPFLDCAWRAERHDAMRVAAALRIPFLTFDLEQEYKQSVVDYMVAAYAAGQTPNPDVVCNRAVKFGAFWKRTRSLGAEYIATGHYARIEKQNDAYEMLAGVDTNKDQSYFLWTLTQEDLSHTFFPVGHLQKQEVRARAAAFNLSTATKKDSQGLCFLGAVDLKDFLRHYIPAQRGAVINESGKRIGTHDGAAFYTIGQRHGFTVTKKQPTDGPYYILEKNIAENTLVVSAAPETGRSPLLTTAPIVLKETNWIRKTPADGEGVTARIRYRQPLQDATVRHTDVAAGTAEITFAGAQRAVSSGQSLVVYRGDVCLGGGIIV